MFMISLSLFMKSLPLSFCRTLIARLGLVSLLTLTSATSTNSEKAGLVSPKITRERAIETASREVLKWGLNPKDLLIEVHNDGERFWNTYMEMLKRSPGVEQQRQYARWNSKLHGRKFWAIVYSTRAPEGRVVKDGGGTVLIDSNSGEVLLTSCALAICD